jgi:hypothetical protein
VVQKVPPPEKKIARPFIYTSGGIKARRAKPRGSSNELPGRSRGTNITLCQAGRFLPYRAKTIIAGAGRSVKRLETPLAAVPGGPFHHYSTYTTIVRTSRQSPVEAQKPVRRYGHANPRRAEVDAGWVGRAPLPEPCAWLWFSFLPHLTAPHPVLYDARDAIVKAGQMARFQTLLRGCPSFSLYPHSFVTGFPLNCNRV